MLVVVQVAMSLSLLVAGGLFARAALRASTSDPGFRYDRLVLASIDPSLAGADERRGRTLHRESLDRLRALPGVEAVALSSTLPFGDFHEGERIERVGSKTPAEPPWATYRVISSDYFRSLGVPVVRGQEFTKEEERSPDAPRAAIIDAALATKVFGSEDPLGQSVKIAPVEARRDL